MTSCHRTGGAKRARSDTAAWNEVSGRDCKVEGVEGKA